MKLTPRGDIYYHSSKLRNSYEKLFNKNNVSFFFLLKRLKQTHFNIVKPLLRVVTWNLFSVQRKKKTAILNNVFHTKLYYKIN